MTIFDKIRQITLIGYCAHEVVLLNEFEENKYTEIKEELLNNEVEKVVSKYVVDRNELSRYFNVGKLLIEAQGGSERAKYGDSLIKKYS